VPSSWAPVPLRIAGVEDEPAGAGGNEARVRPLEPRFRNHRRIVGQRARLAGRRPIDETARVPVSAIALPGRGPA